jgi:hypothetical protein
VENKKNIIFSKKERMKYTYRSLLLYSSEEMVTDSELSGSRTSMGRSGDTETEGCSLSKTEGGESNDWLVAV